MGSTFFAYTVYCEMHQSHKVKIECIIHIIIKGCGGHLKREYGSFQSPNYPHLYHLNTDCIWYITAKPGKKIELTFQDIDMERENNCVYDFVKVLTFITLF